MVCPICGNEMSFSNRIDYNNIEMCVCCAYQLMPDDSPGRTQFERNYPDLINDLKGGEGRESSMDL